MKTELNQTYTYTDIYVYSEWLLSNSILFLENSLHHYFCHHFNHLGLGSRI